MVWYATVPALTAVVEGMAVGWGVGCGVGVGGNAVPAHDCCC